MKLIDKVVVTMVIFFFFVILYFKGINLHNINYAKPKSWKFRNGVIHIVLTHKNRQN